jgi:hypothetical protein
MSLDNLDTAFATLAAGVGAFNSDPDPAHALATLEKLLIDVKIIAAQGVLVWVAENYDSPGAPRMLAAAIRMLASARLDLGKAAIGELRRSGGLQ